LVATDGKIKLGLSGGTGNLLVNWSTGQTGSEIKDLQVGFYTVTITDGNGCTQQFTYEIKWTVAVDDLSDGLVQVFPNPVVDRLWVRATGSEFEFLSMDINGSVRVQRQGLMEGNYCFNMGHLPAGIYFWEVLRFGEIVKVGKVVKIE